MDTLLSVTTTCCCFVRVKVPFLYVSLFPPSYPLLPRLTGWLPPLNRPLGPGLWNSLLRNPISRDRDPAPGLIYVPVFPPSYHMLPRLTGWLPPLNRPVGINLRQRLRLFVLLIFLSFLLVIICTRGSRIGYLHSTGLWVSY